jgi:hypothetical protein
MKILISQQQYNIILEQSVIGLGPTTAKIDPKEFDAHTKNTILQLASAFIPYVGPLISTGFGLYDAKMYYDEGDKTSASIVAVLSVIPMMGSLLSKLPITKSIGKKGMDILSNKLIKKGEQKVLTQTEKKVVDEIAKNKEVVTKEIDNLINNALKKQKKPAGIPKPRLKNFSFNPIYYKQWVAEYTNFIELNVKYYSNTIGRDAMLEGLNSINNFTKSGGKLSETARKILNMDEMVDGFITISEKFPFEYTKLWNNIIKKSRKITDKIDEFYGPHNINPFSLNN